MTLFSASGLSRSFNDVPLFDGISFGMQAGERVGIIGRNGAGKTSLLRLIAGLDEPDAGEVARGRDVRIEYLDQAPSFDTDATALTAVMQAHDEGHGHLETWEVETRARRYLGKLGMHDAERDVHTMSGGQRKRVAIARALMMEPDLLILDEPTNHLDADSVQWLQDELAQSSRALLLVTHDRYFLDAVCTSIVELDQHRLITYEGSYEKYLERKTTMVEVQDATAAHQRNKLRRELAWLAKGAKARRTKQKSRIDWIAQMEAEPATTEQRDIQIELGHRFLGGRIIDADDVGVQINDDANAPRWLFRHVSWKAQPGSAIGIIGPNGAGKSTLLRVLGGRQQPDEGWVNVGESVTLGYFEQEIKDLVDSDTVIGNVRAIAEYIDVGIGRDRYISARELCERFAFDGKQQHSFVSTLSGGERRRLALLRVLMANPNVLFLDEPTNDFDLATLSALEDYLQYFKGVLLVVSHDRAFLDKVVDTIWSFEGGGRVKEYPGNYSAYLERLEGTGRDQRGLEGTGRDQRGPEGKRKVEKRSSDGKPKKTQKELHDLEKLEKRIALLEERKEELEQLLGSGTVGHEELAALGTELHSVMNEIDELTERWLEMG
jgi:ABC transport system ATP-binding/permease protein